MEIGKWPEKIAGLLKKYKYPIILLCIGMILMGLPSFSGEKEPARWGNWLRCPHPRSPRPGGTGADSEKYLRRRDVKVMLTISQERKPCIRQMW